MDDPTTINENKRKCDEIDKDEGANKKFKVGSSLGLSLLQAYGEEECNSSDEEDKTISTDSGSIVIEGSDQIKAEISRTTIFNNVDVCSVRENDEREVIFKFENRVELHSKLAEDEVEETEHSVGPLDKSEQSEVVSQFIDDTSDKFEVQADKRGISIDQELSVFGKENVDCSSSDIEKSESKPVKKVKLNRSKFTKDIPESKESPNSSSSSSSIHSSSPSSISALSSFYNKSNSNIKTDDKLPVSSLVPQVEDVLANDGVNEKIEVMLDDDSSENSGLKSQESMLDVVEVNFGLHSTEFVDMSENNVIVLNEEDKISDSQDSLEEPTAVPESIIDYSSEAERPPIIEDEVKMLVTEPESFEICAQIENYQSNPEFEKEELQPIELINESETDDSPNNVEFVEDAHLVDQEEEIGQKCEKLTQGSKLSTEDLIIVKNKLLLEPTEEILCNIVDIRKVCEDTREVRETVQLPEQSLLTENPEPVQQPVCKVIEKPKAPQEVLGTPEESTPIVEISDEEIYEDATDIAPEAAKVPSAQPQMFVTWPGELSKLEQALTGMLNRPSQNRLPEPASVAPISVPASTPTTIPVRTPAQKPEDVKQNIKLHLSVQGDRVSIKHPTHGTRDTPDTLPSQSGIKMKRAYRRRTKVAAELEAEQANAKQYANRLRQRNAERLTPGAKKRGPKGPRKKKLENDQDQNSEFSDVSSSAECTPGLPAKVQPIKLKISKNANVTIKPPTPTLQPGYHPTQSEEHSPRVPVAHIEENYRASAWSSPDMQRVERMLNQANVTITPVGPQPQAHPQHFHPLYQDMQQSSIRAMLTAPPKNVFHRSEQPLDFSQSLPSAPLPSAMPSAPPAPTHLRIPSSYPHIKPLNISLRPLDANQQNSEWCVTNNMSEGKESLKSTPENRHVAPEIQAKPPLDVKSEIRKKIALAEKQKQEMSLAASAAARPFVKLDRSLPDLVAINDTMLPGSPVAESMQKMLMAKTESVTPSTHNVVVSLPPLAANYSTPIMQPTELFVKRRGRPSKAMVAAREAFKQRQEEIEKMKQLTSPSCASGLTQALVAAVKEEGRENTSQWSESSILSDFQISSPVMRNTEQCVSTPGAKSTLASGLAEPSSTPIKARRGRRPKERKSSDEQSSGEPQLPNPEREAEEQRRLQEERIRKEEERERKNEVRRIRAKERSDLAKAKRLRQKMKAKERHKAAKERKRQQMEEKKKLEEQLKRMPAFDDETRMSADNSEVVHVSYSAGMMEDDSSNATNDASQKKKSRMEVTDADSQGMLVEQIAEYQWPIQGGELYMIQEQVSNFLVVKSFKRKYPDIKRRPVDSEERAYLVDSGLVSETLCDLGITAVCSAEVLDIMCQDFPTKYEEFRKYMREKQMKELSYKQKAWAIGLGYKLLMADGSKQDLKKRAMESTSNWNAALNKNRKEDRRCHMDLQTFIVHFPKTKSSKMSMPTPKIGSYPVSILPGQFCDYYKDYTPTELRYMPVNTVLYGPLKHPLGTDADGNQSDSDDSSSSDESSTTSEGTQGTEDTNEDIDKDMLLDEINDKVPDALDKDTSTPQKDSTVPTSNGSIVTDFINACKVCLGNQERNKLGQPEVLIQCSQCSSNSHPTCLDLCLSMVDQIKSYEWQCPDCKSCAKCKENSDEDKMLFCDTCDRGLHIYCVGLKKVPTGSWQCGVCSTTENTTGNIEIQSEVETMVAISSSDTELIQIAE